MIVYIASLRGTQGHSEGALAVTSGHARVLPVI
jgi:hypothetical protein